MAGIKVMLQPHMTHLALFGGHLGHLLPLEDQALEATAHRIVKMAMLANIANRAVSTPDKT